MRPGRPKMPTMAAPSAAPIKAMERSTRIIRGPPRFQCWRRPAPPAGQPGFLGSEFLVVGADDDHKFIARDQVKPFHGQQRMMQARELVQGQHAHQGANGRAHDQHDVRRHKGHRRAEHRFAAHDEGIIKRVRIPDQADDGGRSAPAHGQREKANVGIAVAHDLVQAVNREGGEHVPAMVAGGADFFGRVQHGGRGIKLGHEAVELDAHERPPFLAPPSAWWGSACGRTDLTSPMGIMGRNFTNSK